MGHPRADPVDCLQVQVAACSAASTLPPLGSSGTKWRFKAKGDGLQKVQLKSLAPKVPGMSQILVKAKRWFGAAAANDVAANTRLTIGIGSTQCYTHAATKKTD